LLAVYFSGNSAAQCGGPIERGIHVGKDVLGAYMLMEFGPRKRRTTIGVISWTWLVRFVSLSRSTCFP